MTLEVTTAANTRILADVNDVAKILGISDETEFPQLERLIEMASSMAEDYCNRVFAKQTYKEAMATNGEPFVILSRAPLISLDAVTYDGQDFSSDVSIYNKAAAKLFRPDGFISTQTITYNILFEPHGPGRQLWEFTYQAGYTLPGEVANYTLPNTIVHAVARLTNWLRQDEQQINPAVQSMDFGDSGVTFRNDAATGLPASVAAMLKPWRLTF